MQKQITDYSYWKLILIPALAMMLGWGLRGHIGGGPFGAMIPGALFALAVSLLFNFPKYFASLFVIFSTVGIGIGGVMTYGQTLTFLRDPLTIYWGLLGITIKGSVWGLMGGAILGTGTIIRRIKLKAFIGAWCFMFLGMIIGFKLINEPMTVYFSNPDNPRQESWAALLSGAVAFLVFMRVMLKTTDFKIVLRFAILGLAGGGLGFGVGSLWIIAGSHLQDSVIFHNWWKCMEWTFGFLLGGSLGLAVWLNRNELLLETTKQQNSISGSHFSGIKELFIALLGGLIIYVVIPYSVQELMKVVNSTDNLLYIGLQVLLKIFGNYTFLGFLLLLLAILFPQAAWQLSITLTFCHAAIDLIRDFYPDVSPYLPFTGRFFFIFAMTGLISWLTYIFQRRKQFIYHLFLLLIWSCISISLLRNFINIEQLTISGLSFCEIICKKFFVDIAFIIMAMVISILAT